MERAILAPVRFSVFSPCWSVRQWCTGVCHPWGGRDTYESEGSSGTPMLSGTCRLAGADVACCLQIWLITAPCSMPIKRRSPSWTCTICCTRSCPTRTSCLWRSCLRARPGPTAALTPFCQSTHSCRCALISPRLLKLRPRPAPFHWPSRTRQKPSACAALAMPVSRQCPAHASRKITVGRLVECLRAATAVSAVRIASTDLSILLECACFGDCTCIGLTWP